MCLGVPMKIVRVDGETVFAEVDGVQREASIMLLGDDVDVNDYVIVHAGFAISKLDPKEAEETLQMMREVFRDDDMA